MFKNLLIAMDLSPASICLLRCMAPLRGVGAESATLIHVMDIQATRDTVGKVWPYVLAGIALGAGIHVYVPENFMAGMMGAQAWWSVPLAVLIGIPMYSNPAGIIPVVQALLGKGAALGTVLAFMMAVIGLSLTSTLM